ncbi:hypothetical protein [Jiulongibacter sediminis]|uniref:Lipoprotein n=1 Tax=Jiulongibacter sediminis TaxID=1605367 RepID=A0A0N8H9Y8_9BACT|nr:hypothetical protein [Jiulongibacter sediminis]KPM48692.1 hypothetical protein AFM12_08855 [Jiulongibacter sediminis]TBX25227.1 hypothetical protein TK44_08860 [Jiulongibacter sediminis]
MKLKLLLSVAAIVLVFASCRKKAGPLNCAAASVRYSESFSDFFNNETRGNCEAVKKSIQDLYQSCTTLATADRESYEEFENSFDCSDY